MTCAHLFTYLKFLTLRSLIDIPRILIFRKFSTQDILIVHPLFIKFQKMFQPGHVDSNKKSFQLFS